MTPGVWIAMLLPFVLVLGRVSAFFAVLPLFGWRSLPMRVRVGVAVIMSIFFAYLLPVPEVARGQVHWASAGVLLIMEILLGLGLGLAVSLLFNTAEQAGRFAGRQMGFAMANVINPVTGDNASMMGLFFEICFSLLFLAAGGHQLLVLIIAQSYRAFPTGQVPEIGVMTEAVLTAGTAMLTFALQLAAPLLATSIILTVVMGIAARAMPEMNILMLSFPLRIGLGLFMAATMLPFTTVVIGQIAETMCRIVP